MATHTGLSLVSLHDPGGEWVTEKNTKPHPRLSFYWQLTAAGGGACFLEWCSHWQVAHDPVNKPPLVLTQLTLTQ